MIVAKSIWKKIFEFSEKTFVSETNVSKPNTALKIVKHVNKILETTMHLCIQFDGKHLDKSVILMIEPISCKMT